MGVQTPARLPSQIILLAARTLPPSHRERYRLEFDAELHFIPREAQLRYATRVLSHAWSLRAALNQLVPEANEGNSMSKVRDRVPLSCRLHLHHQWRRFVTEDGGRYKACVKCGKELPPSSFDKNTLGA